MFDTHVTKVERGGPSFITKTVHEHRAPTDDSIRLGLEVRDKVLDSMVGRMDVPDNQFKCEVASFVSHESWESVLAIKYQMNGIDYLFKKRYDPCRHNDIDVLAREILTDFSKHLTDNMLPYLIPGIIGSINRNGVRR